MPLPKRKIELVDSETGEVVSVFNSLHECAKKLNIGVSKVHKICNDKAKKPRYYPRYKDNAPTFVVDTTRAWHCDIHRVWIRKGQPCPLCKAKK